VRWHDKTLRSLFAAYGGVENDHAGDGFFVVFQTTTAAANCAIDIQKTLRRHRAESGFAPEVRIGIHSAEVIETDRSHTGLEVHKAARIAALAGGGEIVVSADVGRDLSPGLNFSEPRRVSVKGLADSCEVMTLLAAIGP
jgi:class 3 adenylate cyclase